MTLDEVHCYIHLLFVATTYGKVSLWKTQGPFFHLLFGHPVIFFRISYMVGCVVKRKLLGSVGAAL